MIAAFIVLALVVVLVRHRARRRATLAGLDGSRPVFSVDPPTRRLTSRRNEAL